MIVNDLTKDLFEVQYEKGYLQRTTQGGIVKFPDVALTELIANAHDAGATLVNITIPHSYDELLVIEDNGVGMTEDNFKNRWMKLSYSRLDHQGGKVSFPEKLKEIKRKAYGSNGVGRHGLLCFGDDYKVKTWTSGEENIFELTSLEDGKPLFVKSHESKERDGHGTYLGVRVTKNLSSVDVIRETLSYRFFSMPDFEIRVNGENIKLSEHPGVVDEQQIKVNGNLFKITLVDTKISRKDSHFQGVGIWVGGRRVGEQGWRLGSYSFTDARKTFSKRYAVIVETDDLREDILPDWSGFILKSAAVQNLAEFLSGYIAEKRKELLVDEVVQRKEEALGSVGIELADLPTLARADVSDFIDDMLEENPELDLETLVLAVKAAINLERSHLGQNLLVKLTTIDPEDVDALDEMLDEWSARDAFKALNEIDARLKVIEALARLTEDKTVDELHTIHPLILRARWLFGYEYETSAYTSSNVGLVKTIKKVFNERISPEAFENSRKRPDIVVLKENDAIAGYAVEDTDMDEQVCVRKVLLIEVKRGGFEIKKEEIRQAEDYVEEIFNCGILLPKPYITAFVVGERVGAKISTRKELSDSEGNAMGIVIAKPYSSLISTAEARLFKLRRTLENRYDSIKTEKLKEQSLTINQKLV